MQAPSQIVLRLPELILIILENVLSSGTNSVPRPGERSTLAAAARVRKAWTAPALTVLWRGLDTLAPLVLLLPTAKLVGIDDSDEDSDYDEMNDMDNDAALVSYVDLLIAITHVVVHLCQVLTDNPGPEDWTRFIHYSARVRILDLGCSERHHSRSIIVDLSVYECLSQMNDGKPLLPHLRELSWSQKGANDRRIIYLASPTLRRLHIQTKDGSENLRMVLHRSRYLRDIIGRRRYKEPRRRDHALRCILREVLLRAVNLEHLTLDGVHHLATIAPVSSCPRVETLELRCSLANSTVDVPRLIATLGGLATLARLTMPVDQTWELEDDILQPSVHRFESLETLCLSTRIGKKPQSPALAFATADCQRLRKLSMEFDTEDASKPVLFSDLRQLLRLPAGFAHICTLHVSFKEPIKWGSVPLRLSDFLLPLATLHKLEQLYLVSEETLLACTDEDIRLLTRHWQNIKSFAATFLSQDGHPSVRALKHIVQGWPRLEVLCLPSLRDLAEFDKNVRPHVHLRHIGILSFVTHKDRAEVANFAVYLSLQFPSLVTERPFPLRLGDSGYAWQPCHSWWKILEVVKQARSVIQRRYKQAWH